MLQSAYEKDKLFDAQEVVLGSDSNKNGCYIKFLVSNFWADVEHIEINRSVHNTSITIFWSSSNRKNGTGQTKISTADKRKLFKVVPEKIIWMF